MIEQLADAFARIFVGSKDIDQSQALFEIEGALAEVFRTRRELLFMRPEEQIEDFDPRLCAEVGRLFLKHAELSESQGLGAAAERSYALGVHCIRKAVGQELSNTDKSATDVLRELLRSARTAGVLDAEEMAEAWRDIFEYEARCQRYPLAEDALFHAIDLAKDPADHCQRGIRWYKALLKLPDELLEERDLPRVEAEEALDELRSG